MMKTCNACKDPKKLGDFHRDKGAKDGRAGTCKACASERAMKWKRENPGRAKATDRRYAHSEKGKAAGRRHYANNKDGVREAQRRFRAKHGPERGRAHNAVFRALRRGDLVRPENCEGCGKPCEVEAHHDDYSKPLEVDWLCSKCHGAVRETNAARRT